MRNISKMITICIISLLLVGIPYAFSQDDAKLPDNVFGAGASFNGYATPNIAGSLLYAKLMSSETNTYSYTFVDVISKKEDTYSAAHSITTGIAQHLRDVGGLPIYAVGSVGFLAGDEDIGFSYTAGVASAIPLKVSGLDKRGWRLIPNVRWLGNEFTGNQPIFGLLLAWGDDK